MTPNLLSTLKCDKFQKIIKLHQKRIFLRLIKLKIKLNIRYLNIIKLTEFSPL